MLDGSGVRTLAELHEASLKFKKYMAAETRWDLCTACKVMPCDPKAIMCLCRRHQRERAIGWYQANPERKRKRQRVKNMTPEQIQKQRDREAKYKLEAKLELKVKRYERATASKATGGDSCRDGAFPEHRQGEEGGPML